MAFTCKFETLDPDTRGYLQAVRTRQGRHTAGVFAAGGAEVLPWIGLVVGPFVGLLMVLGSFGGNKSPAATAMLQTAGVLVGGWPVWYAVRRWASGGSRWYGGRFQFFDPLHVYQVDGETVTVNGLQAVRGVEARGAAVQFDLGERGLRVPVGSAKKAAEVEEYYAAMAELEGRPDGRWANAGPAELGAAARYFADTEEEPREVSDTGLEVAEVPDAPAVAARAGWGVGGLLLITLAGAGLFAAFWAVNVPLGDEIAFGRAKEGGAPGLRAYLLDPRNTSHRDEARQLLAKAYDLPVAHLKGLDPGEQPALRDALVKLLDALRTSDSPVVSIRVTSETPGDDMATSLRSELADGLARSIGPELIAFVGPPDDKPAHLTVKYTLPQAKPDGDENQGIPEVVALTVEVRATLDGEPAAASWRVPLKINPGVEGVQRLDLLKQELCRELVGEWRPAPAAVRRRGVLSRLPARVWRPFGTRFALGGHV